MWTSFILCMLFACKCLPCVDIREPWDCCWASPSWMLCKHRQQAQSCHSINTLNYHTGAHYVIFLQYNKAVSLPDQKGTKKSSSLLVYTLIPWKQRVSVTGLKHGWTWLFPIKKFTYMQMHYSFFFVFFYSKKILLTFINFSVFL